MSRTIKNDTSPPKGREIVDAITRAFDLVAVAWGEDHPVALALSRAMREAARCVVGRSAA